MATLDESPEKVDWADELRTLCVGVVTLAGGVALVWLAVILRLGHIILGLGLMFVLVLFAYTIGMAARGLLSIGRSSTMTGPR